MPIRSVGWAKNTADITLRRDVVTLNRNDPAEERIATGRWVH